jgi:hypothetical protein
MFRRARDQKGGRGRGRGRLFDVVSRVFSKGCVYGGMEGRTDMRTILHTRFSMLL